MGGKIHQKPGVKDNYPESLGVAGSKIWSSGWAGSERGRRVFLGDDQTHSLVGKQEHYTGAMELRGGTGKLKRGPRLMKNTLREDVSGIPVRHDGRGLERIAKGRAITGDPPYIKVLWGGKKHQA